MSNDINLVSTNKRKKPSSRRILFFRKVAIICVMTTFAVTVIVFLLSMRYSLQNAKRSQDEALLQLSPFHKNIAKLSLLNDRIASARQIIESRSDIAEILDAILTKKPTDVSAKNLEFAGNKITITFSSASLLSLNTFLDDITNLKSSNKKIKSLFMSDLKLDTEGTYLMTIVIN